MVSQLSRAKINYWMLNFLLTQIEFFNVFLWRLKPSNFQVLICISFKLWFIVCHTLFNLQGTLAGFLFRPAFTAELHNSTLLLLLSSLFFNHFLAFWLPPWRELVYNNTLLTSCQACFFFFRQVFSLSLFPQQLLTIQMRIDFLGNPIYTRFY